MIGGKSASRNAPTALGVMLQASSYNATIPTIFGTCKSPLIIIWGQNLRQGGSGKKGKKKGVTTYVENLDFLIGSNPIEGALQCWLNANRYPLNFVTHITGGQSFQTPATVTITDPTFYFVIGVTVDVTISGTFNDYGGTPISWETNMPYPLWNKANHGPDLINAGGARWAPWTFKWEPSDGPVVSFPDTSTLGFGLLPINGNLTIYYAQFAAASHNQAPIAFNRMTFESELGNGDEFTGNINGTSTPLSSQQIIYPMYAGLGSQDYDLGAAGALPDTRVEVKGSHALYSRGDADFMDMVEDILKSGMLQVGSELSYVQRGLNLNDLPGPVQLNLFIGFELSTPSVPYYQPNTEGSLLVAVYASRLQTPAPGSPPLISDTQGNTWNLVFNNNQRAIWYSDPAIGGADNVVNTLAGGGGSGFNFSAATFIMELDPATTAFGTSNSTSGNDPNLNGGFATGTITVTGNPGTPIFLIAVAFADTGSFFKVPYGWTALFPITFVNYGGTAIFTRTVYGPGTYPISIPMFGPSNWYVTMMSFTQPQAPPYTNALGNILDAGTSQTARLGCRASGLIGSVSMNSQQNGSDWLQQIFECSNTAPFWSGFRLKTVFRSEVSAFGNGAVYVSPTASGPVVNITESMMIGDKSGPLVTVTNKTPSIDTPNILQMEFLDRGGDYNTAVASWPDAATVSIYGPKKESPKVLHEIVDPTVAIKILAIQARRMTLVTPIEYAFKGKANLSLLEPMDLVTINDSYLGMTALPVRLTSVSEDSDHNFDFKAEPFLYGVHAPDATLTATAASPYQPTFGATPESVNTPIFIETVPRLSSTAQLWIPVSDPDPNYGGCAVYMSTDGGNSYNPVGQITGNAITGVTTTVWPSANDPDTVNNLPVNLTESNGTLLSYQVSDEDNFVYPCYVAGGNANIPYELMTYAVATLTATNQYTLMATGGSNHLRRAVFAAPQPLTGVTHVLGSRWAFLNPSGQGIFKIAINPIWIGQTLYFKFLAFNTFQGGLQALAAAEPYTYTPTGIPGQLTGGSSGPNNQYTITTGGTLTNPTSTTIHMAQATVTFSSGSILNYNARTISIPSPSVPTTYYITIADPSLIGDTGTGDTLTPTASASTATVGVAGNIYIGSITVIPGGGGTVTSPGGNPASLSSGQLFLVNGT